MALAIDIMKKHSLCSKVHCMCLPYKKVMLLLFLNQAHAWFLEIVPVQMSVCVFVCVCVPAPEAINN